MQMTTMNGGQRDGAGSTMLLKCGGAYASHGWRLS